MLDLNNTGKQKNLSFIALINYIWKFKKSFFYILITLSLLSFLLESLVPKKTVIKIQLKEREQIELDTYPSQSTLPHILSSAMIIQFKDEDQNQLDIYPSQTTLSYILSRDLSPLANFGQGAYGNGLLYHDKYFIRNMVSKKNLKDFAKLNNKKYNLYKFIDKNDVIVSEADMASSYKIILPKNPKNENFFREYVAFTASIAFNKFKKNVTRTELKKFSTLEKDQLKINQILEEHTKTLKGTSGEGKIKEENNMLMNLKIIVSIYDQLKISINENLAYIKNLDTSYNEDWILELKSKTANEQYYNYVKFILPVILSLIIYLIYILIKLSKKDNEN